MAKEPNTDEFAELAKALMQPTCKKEFTAVHIIEHGCFKIEFNDVGRFRLVYENEYVGPDVDYTSLATVETQKGFVYMAVSQYWDGLLPIKSETVYQLVKVAG